MAGFENTIVFSNGEKLSPSSSDDISRMQEQSTDISRINHVGNPEGVVSANPASLSHDPVSGFIYVKETGTGNTGWGLLTTSASDLHAARFIVSAGGTADGANYTTFASAYAAAVSAGGNQTIFLQPGTYSVGSQALADGINVAAFDCDALTPNVTLVGKLTATFAGQLSISGIRFQTDSDYCLEVTGSSATILNFKNCFVQAADNTAIHFASSSGSSKMSFFQCRGQIDTTGIAYFTHTSAGALAFESPKFENDGGSTTASTVTSDAGGAVAIHGGYFNNSITSSGNSSVVDLVNVEYNGSLIVNSTVSSGNIFSNSYIRSGSASAIALGAGSTIELTNSSIASSNTNAIAGSGTLNSAGVAFTDISSTIEGTVTQNALPFLPSSSPSTPVNWSVQLSSNQSNVTGNNVQYKIPYDTVISDSASGYNTGTHTYTVPETGLYNLIRSDFLIGGTAASTLFFGWYSINAAAFPGTRVIDMNPAALGLAANSEFIYTTSNIVSLTAGDTIEVYADVIGGVGNDVGVGGTYTLFSGYKIN